VSQAHIFLSSPAFLKKRKISSSVLFSPFFSKNRCATVTAKKNAYRTGKERERERVGIALISLSLSFPLSFPLSFESFCGERYKERYKEREREREREREVESVK